MDCQKRIVFLIGNNPLNKIDMKEINNNKTQ